MSDYLQQDLWREIIKRLPVESVARFRCVCREWNAFICSASFIADHLACSKTRPPRLFLNNIYPDFGARTWKCALIDDPGMHDERAVTLIRPIPTETSERIHNEYGLVGSANGIICLSRESAYYPGVEIILWNPVINKYIRLPTQNIWCAPTDLHVHLSIAMGVKSREDDLRVLELSRYVLDEQLVAEIYSVRHGVWRNLQADFPTNDIYGNFHEQAYINGAAHWVVAADSGPWRLFMMCFDFEEEKFSSMTLPDLVADSKSDVNAGIYHDRLAVIEHVDACACTKIWVMSEYGNVDSWSFIIRFDGLESSNHINRGFTNDGKIILSGSKNCYMLLYDPTSRSLHWLDFYAKKTTYACKLVESLVFMDGLGGAATLY